MAGEKETRSKVEVHHLREDQIMLKQQVGALEEEVKKKLESIELGQDNHIRRMVEIEERMMKELKQQNELLTAKMAEMVSLAMSKRKEVVEGDPSESSLTKGNFVQNNSLSPNHPNQDSNPSDPSQKQASNDFSFPTPIAATQTQTTPIVPILTPSPTNNGTNPYLPQNTPQMPSSYYNEPVHSSISHNPIYNLHPMNQYPNYVGTNTRPPEFLYNPNKYPYQTYRPPSLSQTQSNAPVYT